MNRAPPASRPLFSERVSSRLPHPGQLAGLGTVLCLYRNGDSELGGWRQAASVSSLGAAMARRIAYIEGAQGQMWIDDGCHAAAARRARPDTSVDASHVVRF